MEPRLKKKIQDLFARGITNIKAKSVEYELISCILRHFKDYDMLYNKACENLKSFIDNSDGNCKQYFTNSGLIKFIVRSLGLRSLQIVLKNNPEFINTCIEYLLESFKKGDKNTKRLILNIFDNYAGAGTLEAAVNTILHSLEQEHDLSLSSAIIETIIKVCRNNNYANIEDLEWFVNTVLRKLLLAVKDGETGAMVTYTLIVIV